MDLLTPGHIVLVVIGALIIFGPKHLPEIGTALGKAIREFRQAVSQTANQDEEPPEKPPREEP
jgi:sec-independent protein translocase protein TatA